MQPLTCAEMQRIVGACAVLLAVVTACSLEAQGLQALERGRQPPSDSLAAPVFVGRWILDVRRSHYGASAEPRRSEHFDCAARGDSLRCRIRSEYASGRVVIANFEAPLSGAVGPLRGLPDVDSVRIVGVAPGIADATFSHRGKPVFGYRAYRAASDRALTIVAVDPVRRIALTSIVVYNRAP